MNNLGITFKIYMIKIGIIAGAIGLAFVMIVGLAGGTSSKKSGTTSGSTGSGYTSITGEGEISLTTSSFGDNKAGFVKAMQAFYDKTSNPNFYNNFLSKVDILWEKSLEYGVNPELVVITARQEGNFQIAGGSFNYWGIGVPNNASSGTSYSSFADGIKGYAETLKAYETGGSFDSPITAKYEARKNSGCDPNGYGLPGTFSGMQSVYSDLGSHVYGNSGLGGYYYMDPARAGVTKIYKTHEEFLSKCYNAGGEHASGKDCTNYEKGQYTAYQVEMKLDFWNEMFKDYIE